MTDRANGQGNTKPRTMRTRTRRGAWLLAIAAVIGAGSFVLRSDLGQGLFGRASIAATVTQDRSTFYRLKVKIAYKGEQQDFDIVVGCNVVQTHYASGGGTSYEAGLVPTVFGQRMSDGKGLVVRPPTACEGETTANGQVQPDLLPIIVVFDDADTLAFGIAYLSEDAYESPLSVLKFGGATVETATRSEFDEFRRTQPNLVTRESYHSALTGSVVLKAMNVKLVPRPLGTRCEGYLRYRIPEEHRALVRRDWPEGRPHYWLADTYEVEGEMTHAILNSKLIQSDGDRDPPRPPAAFSWLNDWAGKYGLATRAGGGLVSPYHEHNFPGAYYPAANDDRVDKWPLDPQGRTSYLAAHDRFAYVDIDFRGGAMRGFAYCASRVNPGDVASDKASEFVGSLAGKRTFGRVDGEEIFQKRKPSPIEPWIFERDDYVLRFFKINLESTRGDV
jgi:hypothetical protein